MSHLAVLNISPTKDVVVVFPFVPVIPMKVGLFDNSYANSTSPITFIFLEYSFCINGKSRGTPGDTTAKSIWSTSSGWYPSI